MICERAQVVSGVARRRENKAAHVVAVAIEVTTTHRRCDRPSSALSREDDTVGQLCHAERRVGRQLSDGVEEPEVARIHGGIPRDGDEAFKVLDVSFIVSDGDVDLVGLQKLVEVGHSDEVVPGNDDARAFLEALLRTTTRKFHDGVEEGFVDEDGGRSAMSTERRDEAEELRLEAVTAVRCGQLAARVRHAHAEHSPAAPQEVQSILESALVANDLLAGRFLQLEEDLARDAEVIQQRDEGTVCEVAVGSVGDLESAGDESTH